MSTLHDSVAELVADGQAFIAKLTAVYAQVSVLPDDAKDTPVAVPAAAPGATTDPAPEAPVSPINAAPVIENVPTDPVAAVAAPVETPQAPAAPETAQ